MSISNNVSTVALKTFPMFGAMPDERLAGVSRCAMMRRVSRGSPVVHEGERTDFVYFVLTGNLKVTVSDEEGREVILTLLGQGEMFGEMGVLDDGPRSASVVAVTPSDLVTIPKTDFRRLMQENFDLTWHVMGKMALRLREADRKIESLALMDVYGRVARLLLDMAVVVDDETVVKRRISKQDIAKMIGASREMVSRVMKDLGLRGLIRETPQGIILDDRLNEL